MVAVVAEDVTVAVAADEAVVEADAEGTAGPTPHRWATVVVGRYAPSPASRVHFGIRRWARLIRSSAFRPRCSERLMVEFPIGAGCACILHFGSVSLHSRCPMLCGFIDHVVSDARL